MQKKDGVQHDTAQCRIRGNKQVAVEESPKAVQEFIRRYFTHENIFGVPCWTAFETLSGARVAYGDKKGVGPTHMSDVNYFGSRVANGGLEGESLYDAMKRLKKCKDACFTFSRTWDDGCVDPLSYD